MTRVRRIVAATVVGLVGFAILLTLQSIPNRHGIEANLTDRSTRALRAAGLSTVDVSFTGRDGTVRAHSKDEADRALAIVRAQDGVRVASAQILPAPNPSPQRSAPQPSPNTSPSRSPGPGPTPAPSAPDVQNQLTDLPRITFETGSATLTGQGQTVVGQVAALLRAHPTVRVRIEGHTDSTGTPASNQALSLARAETVRATLVSLGVAADRLSTVGFGASQPLVPDTTPENQAINRRVQFVVLGQ
jgi:outer membrane protein OmpA-like peptidoglycan-associated protein